MWFSNTVWILKPDMTKLYWLLLIFSVPCSCSFWQESEILNPKVSKNPIGLEKKIPVGGRWDGVKMGYNFLKKVMWQKWNSVKSQSSALPFNRKLKVLWWHRSWKNIGGTCTYCQENAQQLMLDLFSEHLIL